MAKLALIGRIFIPLANTDSLNTPQVRKIAKPG
jgi:hypothetical protein